MNDTAQTLHEEENTSIQRSALKKMLLGRRREHIGALEEIDSEIAELQRKLSEKIDDARRRRQPIEEALSHLDALLQIEGWAEAQEDGLHHSGFLGSNGKAPIEAAYDLLTTLGKPLHYRELALRISESGVHLGGKDPAATLLSRMSRDDRFRRGPERGLYGLASWRMRKSSSRKRSSKRPKSRRTQGAPASQQ